MASPNDSSDKGIEKMIAENAVDTEAFFRSTATDTNVAADNVNTAASRSKQDTFLSECDYEKAD